MPLPTLLVAAALLGTSSCKNERTPAKAAASAEPTATTAAQPNVREQLLLATIKVGLPPEGLTEADLPVPTSQGAELTARYCTQCHALPTPTMHSAADWPSIVRRMWLRVERLPDSESLQSAPIGDRVQLLKYLGDHALQVSGATLPPGAGREVFATDCSRCHALPDPHTHGSQDWPAVVLRMERNMERMNVRPISREDIGQILGYLQGPAATH